jgi:hypothetical protein
VHPADGEAVGRLATTDNESVTNAAA